MKARSKKRFLSDAKRARTRAAERAERNVPALELYQGYMQMLAELYQRETQIIKAVGLTAFYVPMRRCANVQRTFDHIRASARDSYFDYCGSAFHG